MAIGTLRRNLLVLAASSALVVSACGPPPPLVVGTTNASGDYSAVILANGVAVCTARVHVEVDLTGNSFATVRANVTSVFGVPGCVYSAWSLSGSVDCVPACGKTYFSLPYLEQSSARLGFTVTPNLAFLRITLSGSWSGVTTTGTDDSAQILCDPAPAQRCVFATPSLN